MEEQECDIIGGLSTLSVSSLSFLSRRELTVFKRLKRITGSVTVFQTLYSSLNFLSNVEVIGNGNLTVDGNNALQDLGLDNLREVTFVQLTNNFLLCFANVIDWASIILSGVPPTITYDQDLLTQLDGVLIFAAQDPSLLNATHFNLAQANPVTCGMRVPLLLHHPTAPPPVSPHGGLQV
jgi:hypothetical protein